MKECYCKTLKPSSCHIPYLPKHFHLGFQYIGPKSSIFCSYESSVLVLQIRELHIHGWKQHPSLLLFMCVCMCLCVLRVCVYE